VEIADGDGTEMVMGASHRTRIVISVLGAGVAALITAPGAAADPPSPAQDGASAADTIADLRDEGYDVQINWVRGMSNDPLSECWTTGVNNPNRSGGPPIGFTTVYVDVACPDHDDDSGFGFGGGFGFG
jgi:hypothetical protein